MNTSKKIRVIAALGTLSGAVWAGTFATFTDSATGTSTFSTGTVDLTLAGDTTDAYAFSTLSFSNMKPGDVKYAPLTVANPGSLSFTYTMATSATNADTKNLGTTLVAGVKTAATCDAAGYALVASTVVVAEGSLATRSISPARTLAPAANEILCFKVDLPSATGDALQGASTTATFTFSATQA